MQKYLLIILLTFITSFSFAQTGTIKGQIKDANTGEEIIGANVFIEGLSIGASTDLEGNYIIEKIPAGSYDVVISYISYKSKKMEGLVVNAGQVTILNTDIEEDVAQLGDVVVIGERETNSEVSLIAEIKEAEQVAVGVSAEQIAKSQDRDAAQAIRRIPGVSLIDNRFVMIRGLSQRYNTVMVNDIITPSSEVDIKSFSFDLVPSNIIDRILIYKSGSADIPGEFAGGVIKIYTKDAPIDNFTTLSVTGGVRIGTTFQDVQKIKGSGTDFLGFDNGSRKLTGGFPAMNYTSPPPFNILSSQQRAVLDNQLETNWLASTINVKPDLRIGFSIGRRFQAGNTTIGNLTAINYSNTNQYAEINLTGYQFGLAQPQLAFDYTDKQITNNVRLGVLHNWLFKFNANNTLEFKNLFNQMSFSETTLREGADFVSTSSEYRNYSYRYESRSIYTGQLVGKHKFNEQRSNLEWIAGFSFTNRQEPDWRRLKTARVIGNAGDFRASVPVVPNPQDAGRFFSNLNETVISGSVNFEQLIGKSGVEEKLTKLRIGTYIEQKNRDFKARFFGYIPIGATGTLSNLPLDQIFTATNVAGTTGTYTLEEATNPSDGYKATNTLLAGYVSAFIPVTSRFSTTLGVRVESNNQSLNSINRNFQNVSGGLNVLSVLPSLNATFDISNKSLLRFAYSASVNRPEFRELAPFDFFDFPFNSNVIGNYKLKSAEIQNLDLRYEFYPSPSELISLGVFYKYFQNPIENFLLFTGNLGSLSYTFVNAESAVSYGAEIEFKKAIGKNFSFVGNASYILSQVTIGDFAEIPDQSGAVNRTSVSDIQDSKRPMMNQSPYLINAGIYYNNEDNGWQFSILYNVYGKRIFAVGNPLNPTVYEMPRNLIDLSVSKTLFDKLEIKFGVQDILNQPVRLMQDVDKNAVIDSKDTQYRSFRRGTSFTLGLTYKF